MLTIFSVPRPFVGIYRTIQRNAIHSWTLLRPRPDIVLLGIDEGTAEVAEEFGVAHIPGIQYSQYGTPRLDSMHRVVEEYSENSLLCIVNADIILMSDFMDAVSRANRHNNDYLMVGQRHNVNIDGPIEFDVTWEPKLRNRIDKMGSLGPRTGEDYIVFPRGHFKNIPSMVVGHSYCDGWLLSEARKRKMDLIDASKVVMAIHQNHDYGHIQKRSDGYVDDPQTRQNELLSGGPDNMLIIKDRTHILTQYHIKPARDLWRIWRLIRTATIIYPDMPIGLRYVLKLMNSGLNLMRRIMIWIRLKEPYRGPRHG